MQIRRGKISENEGIRQVNMLEGFLPKTYLGKPTKKILEEINISLREFESICDKFTNKSIFKKNNKGQLLKDKNGNLIKDFEIK